MKKLTPLALLGAAALLLTGCSLSASGDTGGTVAAGSLAKIGDLSGATIAVGSKEFTEQQILCEITAQALESTGAKVKRECGMSGSATVRSALESGSIDMYWEYTGTGWITHLGKTDPIVDPVELWETLDKTDQAKNGITWLKPAPANNTYAVAVEAKKGKELGVSTLSEYAALANKDAAAASFCGAAEFFGRNDGWPGLEKAYGFDLPRDNTSELAAGAVYNGIAKQNPCNFGEIFATDGRVQALGLTVLKDDKKFFTPYNPAVAVRSDVLKKNPQLADIMAPISEALTDEALQKLNAQVDVDGSTPADVAKKWLQDEGFIGA
ncbi:glycine betaine ABC transporter substrate-binding protein [Leucobacter viscericola]|uniref:Glycine betaine ABC transporter substrate-binding protein n=1 Tax=Leucobacter viscericola TaxID=2714935 RepID=A0A6G7XG03_9MICO|nr:glycine betaine ABC transporter substrate-binding protein [Leucobacter viscericola]QIK63301.1 glycine betaine ABC transporter substrate-binding protein [Leucobacter viscericola]